MEESYTNSKIKRTKLAFDSLSIYRNLLENKALNKLYELLDYLNQEKIDLSYFTNLYNDFFLKLCYSSNKSLKDLVIELILFDENPFSLKLQSKNKEAYILQKTVEKDLNNLQIISSISSSMIKTYALEIFNNIEFSYEIIKNLPDWEPEYKDLSENEQYPNHYKSMRKYLYDCNRWNECIKYLIEYYEKYGCGIFSRYRAFVWENSGHERNFKPIYEFDTISLSDFIGYELERSKIIENTLQFLKGFSANNVLLYGDRGTGKSSTVKALLNEYHNQGLRIIEIPKSYLTDFPLILRAVRNKPQKFIIFIDDLSFKEDDENYTALKALLEGGLENKPNNVLIYATSNRRHLIKETFNDRNGLSSSNANEEIHAADTIQEKLSLADRFGITVVFSAPDKNQYLKIVNGIATKRNISINKEELCKEALKWELSYNGRSPRTARQFIDWLEGHKNLY
jgi:hypothetical protein